MADTGGEGLGVTPPENSLLTMPFRPGVDWLNFSTRALFDYTSPGCVAEPKIKDTDRFTLLV